jgi:hypothetical protein
VSKLSMSVTRHPMTLSHMGVSYCRLYAELLSTEAERPR